MEEQAAAAPQLRKGPGRAACPGARRILGEAAGAPGGRSFGDAEWPAGRAAWFPAGAEAGGGREAAENGVRERQRQPGRGAAGGAQVPGRPRRGLGQVGLLVHGLPPVHEEPPTP